MGRGRHSHKRSGKIETDDAAMNGNGLAPGHAAEPKAKDLALSVLLGGPSVVVEDEWLIFSNIGPFDLDRTLGSGQTFRWSKKGDGYEGVIRKALVEVAQKGDTLWAKTFPIPLQKDLVEDYFALGFPLQEVLTSMAGDNQLASAVARHPGIRLLRQEPWECLASFLLATNKSIPQIEKSIAALCEKLGSKIWAGKRTLSLFPTPEVIANTPEQVLRTTKIGYRAAYLRATAQKLVSQKIDLVRYRKTTYAQAKEALMSLDGIGPKVADCICLFSLDHWEAFPVDVWIQRAMQRYYGGKKRLKLRQMEKIARNKFGKHAGLAQQYLYHDIRSLALEEQ